VPVQIAPGQSPVTPKNLHAERRDHDTAPRAQTREGALLPRPHRLQQALRRPVHQGVQHPGREEPKKENGRSSQPRDYPEAVLQITRRPQEDARA